MTIDDIRDAIFRARNLLRSPSSHPQYEAWALIREAQTILEEVVMHFDIVIKDIRKK